MLKIRLQRLGRRNQPFYRLVVAEHSAPVKGAYMELLGHYNPLRTPQMLELKKERIQHWVGVGAQPSQTVARMLAKNGLKEMEKFIAARKMKPSKAEMEAAKRREEEAEAKKAAAEAAKAAAAPAPAEATPAEVEAPAAENAAPEAPESPDESPEASETPAPEADEPASDEANA